MKAKTPVFVAAALLALAPVGASAIGKNEKGCLVGGAVGGVGALVANDQKKKEGEAKRREDRAKAQARREHRERVAAEERAREGR
jgi:hypothetical protein